MCVGKKNKMRSVAVFVFIYLSVNCEVVHEVWSCLIAFFVCVKRSSYRTAVPPCAKLSPAFLSLKLQKVSSYCVTVYGEKGLPPTVCSYPQAGIITSELSTENCTSNILLSCLTKHKTPACG